MFYILTRRTSKFHEKPVVVVDYNNHMLGVDKLDQLVSYYSFLHKSLKWWRKVYFWMLEVVVVNSYIIYKEHITQHHLQPLSHLAYRRKLIEALSQDQRATRIDSHTHRSIQQEQRLQDSKHFMRKVHKRRDCVICSDRKSGSRRLTPYVCITCTNNPPLCPTPCFETYHTQKRL